MIVVGLGAVGSAALYQLARRGVQAIGIDRFSPPHAQGSSHGETRITRCGVGEGAAYGPLVARSHAIWDEIAAETGEQLLLRCGFMLIDGVSGEARPQQDPGFLDGTLASARANHVPHALLDAGEAARRFPQFLLRGHERVYFEPGGGLVYPERCIAAQLRLAEAHGATVRRDETVVAVTPAGDGVAVRTDRATYSAARAILAAGSWLPGLVGAPLAPIRLLRQVLHWFAVDDPAAYAPSRSPTFIWVHDDPPHDSFYGFPILPGLTPGLKVATEQYTAVTPLPERLDRAVAPSEVAAMFARHVSGRMRGAHRTARQSTACVYTTAPDNDFVIDRLDPGGAVSLVSACSGHGFKHSAAVGELAAENALGLAMPDDRFRLSRLAGAAAVPDPV
ncbi:N-methyl-L-tryptophan oxidase [Sphingomonas profundi]|uniref:N-methyl-L-tryptophan oxidase n=1 Tax=Alterirhizorhabdus profundi TaxID=2681549 RepID=UPI0012E78BD2|nr:N-methyl-L-tryptophan oxidase [Sphingomonas profundi]